MDPMDAHGGRVVCTRPRTAVGGCLGVNLGIIGGRVGPTRTHGSRRGGLGTQADRVVEAGKGDRSQPGEGVMRQARVPISEPALCRPRHDSEQATGGRERVTLTAGPKH